MTKYVFPFVLLALIIAGSGCNMFTPRSIILPSEPRLKITGEGQATPSRMARFLTANNPRLSFKQAKKFAAIYIRESRQENINHDVAFAQMCLETDYLGYGGQVRAGQYNYCGLGATDDGASGAEFDSIRAGVRAHIQHLKAYSSEASLNNPRVDPRFDLVDRGIAPYVDGLAGRWATDPKYAEKIRSVVRRIRED